MTVDHAVLNVNNAIILAAGAAQQTSDGEHHKADNRQTCGHSQKNQTQNETEGQDTDGRQRQPKPGQRALRRLVELSPWIVHVG